VLIEQIDDTGLESLEQGLGDLLDVLRPTIEAWEGLDVEPELGGNHHLVTKGGKRFAHELLVRERTVDFRRVEERDAARDGLLIKAIISRLSPPGP